MRLLALLLALLCAPAPAAELWERIASEGQTWTFLDGIVRYGKDPAWVQKQVNGTGPCTNAFFGSDPAVGLGKVCEALRSFDPPAPAPAASAIRWPSNYFPGADGTPAVLFSTAKVDGLSGFVPDDVAPAASASSPTGWVRPWHWHAYVYCHRDVCSVVNAVTTPVRAIAAVRAASGPTAMGAVADAFEKMLSIPPTPAQAFDIAVWKAQACRDASAPPYKTQPPGGWPSDADPLSKCLPEPTPLPPAGDVWRTPPSGTFTIYTTSAGKINGIAPGRAPATALCDCSANQVQSGTSTYCALSGAAVANVTLCKKVVP